VNNREIDVVGQDWWKMRLGGKQGLDMGSEARIMSRADPRQRGDTAFGPESEHISIPDFVQYAESTLDPGGSFRSLAQKFDAAWKQIPQHQQQSVENEFR
jgi:hypothetical protein